MIKFKGEIFIQELNLALFYILILKQVLYFISILKCTNIVHRFLTLVTVPNIVLKLEVTEMLKPT